jgi:hypothetical protein
MESGGLSLETVIKPNRHKACSNPERHFVCLQMGELGIRTTAIPICNQNCAVVSDLG